MTKSDFGVIVIGGGHAGVDAARASAKMGVPTALLTLKKSQLGEMSCNPAIGGIGKGHLVREIDALGGVMGLAADLAGIQVRTLNRSKGYAVRATRMQTDRNLYKKAVQKIINDCKNLTIIEGLVEDIDIKAGKICAVHTPNASYRADAFLLTTGTFLGGVMYVGNETKVGGRFGDQSAEKLAKKLRELPFTIGRLKTGTPPRIQKDSINYKSLIEQPSEYPLAHFSFFSEPGVHPPQVSCHQTKTNPTTHKHLLEGISKSPLYNGKIKGTGPRYCPSIEDKIFRFADRDSHQIFLEPEGLDSDLVYPNGISTSMPKDIQDKFVHSIEGLEEAKIVRYGYAIEYDYFDPKDLTLSLKSKVIDNLFLAGQINGTTGYEEASGQGVLAGINAALFVKKQNPFILERHKAYIGVMVDDLTTQGTDEPYRMFTSRSEYRLQMREDNADQRLCPAAIKLGLLDDRFVNQFNKKLQALKDGSTPAARKQIEIEKQYSGYLQRQKIEIEKNYAVEQFPIPKNLNYDSIASLSNELKEKLNKQRPQTFGQAGRLPGMTPAAMSILRIYLKRTGMLKNSANMV